MKSVSLILKIAALLAAAFCVFAWFDTRGKIASAESHMKDVAGVDLNEKSSKVPGFLEEIANLTKQRDALRATNATAEQRNNSLSAELETERAKSVQANSELVKKNAEIRTLNADVTSSKQQIADKNALVENLKRELLESKKLLTQNNETDALKERVATLEQQLESKTKDFEEANKKAKLLEMAEVVEVIETDAAGNKVIKKIVKTPYIPSGDIATVLSVDQVNKIVSINRGEAAGVKEDQKILLKREGKLVSEILIKEVNGDVSVGLINRNIAIPETIEIGDLLEMGSPEVAAESQSAPAAAPAAAPEAAPAAPAAAQDA